MQGASAHVCAPEAPHAAQSALAHTASRCGGPLCRSAALVALLAVSLVLGLWLSVVAAARDHAAAEWASRETALAGLGASSCAAEVAQDAQSWLSTFHRTSSVMNAYQSVLDNAGNRSSAHVAASVPDEVVPAFAAYASLHTSLLWLDAVQPHQRDEYEASMTARWSAAPLSDRPSAMVISERAPNGSLVPARSNASLHAPVSAWLWTDAPLTPASAWGLDMLTDPIRGPVIEAAIANNSLVLAPPTPPLVVGASTLVIFALPL